MAYKEKEIEKLYYSIGEVADIFNVAPSLIRFWESEFELIKPKKNRKGNRQFTKEDIDNVRTIYHLVKEKGFTLQGAKEMLKNDSQAVRDKMELIESLKTIRKFFTELRDKLH
ncbi:MAG TPA: MerR family transcriptional regulator [Cyclobacteriaceae bacterium]|nr:MerR family transcriptional regulator [Cyclobacteriaceae bacterium]